MMMMNKNLFTALFVGLVTLLGAATAFTTAPAAATKSFSTALGPVARNGLVYEDVEYGSGRRVLPGDSILCYYKGTYTTTTNNNKGGNPFFGNVGAQSQTVTFDETPPGEPMEFVIGQGQVIPGWDLGICGNVELDIPPMNIGGDRKLLIPSALAYGESGAGNGVIPPNQDLEFQIAVLNAQRKGGISMNMRLGGYAVVAGFAVTVLGTGWFVLHNL
uniref:peptidylprolyl isomerase n=1 Tax=Entomoneis paludosa TaxID=265537 RepID=A0A7S2YII1_9STRA|eukprot:CAMPEP_0172463464 /NCGR_PEP_ID=MMETSP1065-20121228/47305_1 /TAXON_ID=265537 /ORGANISM="Amphiprora paludosa, Strain CCMP125" /LENGTH=216 /DNA_ID=CAMNT_0013219421 /DNA_START=9 /DNA_END=659 /DNA_ORIENTATION=-